MVFFYEEEEGKIVIFETIFMWKFEKYRYPSPMSKCRLGTIKVHVMHKKNQIQMNVSKTAML